MRIAIIGAGPAGSYLAWSLGNTDHNILLFDHRAPYEKPCGGGIGSLVTHHFPEVTALPFPRCYPRSSVYLTSGGSKQEQTVQQSAFSIASRLDFGKELLNKALAESNTRFIREKVKVIKRIENGWRVQTSHGLIFQADFLVGADGVKSVVRKYTVGPIPNQHLSLTVGYFVTDVPNDILVLQTFDDIEGYLWCFPRHDHASIGIGSRLGRIRPQDLWRRLDNFLNNVYPTFHSIKRWAALLPMAKDQTLWDIPCTGNNWALLGDAACHVHPITGEGIAYALWSAKLLAEAFKQGDPLIYEELWRARYGYEFMKISETLCRNVDFDKRNYEFLLYLTLEHGFNGKKVVWE